jgi:hypothetical protein
LKNLRPRNSYHLPLASRLDSTTTLYSTILYHRKEPDTNNTMSLKTSTLRANFSLSGRPNPNNITPPTSPLRSRIRITKHTSRPYTPGNSKPKPNGVAGTNASGGVGAAGSAGTGGVGSSTANSTLGSGSGLGLGATAGMNAAGAAGKKAPSKHIVWYREVSP